MYMGLVKTRRLMAMQKQQKAKAGMKPPMPKRPLPSWSSKPSNLMKMVQAIGEYRMAMESTTDPESIDFNRGEYLFWKERFEIEVAKAQAEKEAAKQKKFKNRSRKDKNNV